MAAAGATGITTTDVLAGAGTAAGAVALALAALYWRRLPLLRRGYEPGAGLTAPVERFQSGVINDFVTWIVLGLACVGVRSPWSSGSAAWPRPGAAKALS